MRITIETPSPLKSLTEGLYRIGLTICKKGEGGFFAQVAAPFKLPGVKIAKDLDSLKIAVET